MTKIATHNQRGIAKNQGGFSVIENLVAIVLIGIAATATVPIIAASFNANSTSRTQAVLLAEVEQLFAGYRSATLNSLLGNISSNLDSIADGAQASIEVPSDLARTTYNITFTALKSASIGKPDGVRITITGTHNRGLFGDIDYSFETVITQLG